MQGVVFSCLRAEAHSEEHRAVAVGEAEGADGVVEGEDLGERRAVGRDAQGVFEGHAAVGGGDLAVLLCAVELDGERQLAVHGVQGLGRYQSLLPQVALEVGKVFETEKNIISYENLGIGRLIYQLPINLCRIFIKDLKT